LSRPSIGGPIDGPFKRTDGKLTYLANSICFAPVVHWGGRDLDDKQTFWPRNVDLNMEEPEKGGRLEYNFDSLGFCFLA